jgi:hypothetical protein
MPVPASINDLSPTESSNSPAGTETPRSADNYLRAHASFIAQLRDGKTEETDLAGTGGAGLVGFQQTGTGAVGRTLQSKGRDVVSARDFGAVGDGVADDTAAVQLAVNHCIATGQDLCVDGMCRLTASVMIDRLVDTAAADKFFTILSNSGGGFITTSDVVMFSSTLTSPYTPAPGQRFPASQMVAFRNVKFEASVSSLVAYVLDQNKFLRLKFDSCQFLRIKCLSSAAGDVIQSIYFFKCQMRRWTGSFFVSPTVTFDLKVNGCLMEAGGGSAFDVALVVGSSWHQNTIQGMASSALIVRGSQGLSVSGNYFEGSPIDLDLSIGDHLGVSLSANYFGGTVPSGDEAVRWGIAENCSSFGNYSSERLHNFTSASKVTTNDYAVIAVSNLGNLYIVPHKFPIGVVSTSTTQSLSSGVFEKVVFSVVDQNTDAGWSAVNNRFQPTAPGYYRVNTALCFNSTSLTMARSIVAFYKNGSEVARVTDYARAGIGFLKTGGEKLIFLNGTSDYVEVYAYAEGSDLQINYSGIGSESSYFELAYVRN